VDKKSLLTEVEAAKQLNVSVAAMRRWRMLGRGPEYLKLYRLVRYKPEALAAFIQQSGVRRAA
jgi:hypothetical protein